MPVIHGDCVEVMRGMEAESVDAIVTDPPYGLGFMGKDWDSAAVLASFPPSALAPDAQRTYPRTGKGPKAVAFDGKGFQSWTEAWAREALRVLKPGGHLLSFGGTRTYHRMTCAIEDAGFEIRDCIVWMYGSGFPKSLDVSKAIDKAAGAERESRIDPKWSARYPNGPGGNNAPTSIGSDGHGGSTLKRDVILTSDPSTPDAQKWSGWGTALKPAHEPIVVARKPLIGTVASNVLAFGTGALNIDGSRIVESSADREAARVPQAEWTRSGTTGASDRRSGQIFEPASGGRWPANVLLSHSEGCVEQGTRRVRGAKGIRGGRVNTGDPHRFKFENDIGQEVGYTDADGLETIPAWQCVEDCAVRLLDEQSGERTSRSASMPLPKGHAFAGATYGGDGAIGQNTLRGFNDTGGASRFFYTAKASKKDRGAGNTHPTVKPQSLMRYLVRLVTPPGGVVLDPFGGSGTTGVAAQAEGFDYILIEREAEYVEIIKRRLDPEQAFGLLHMPQEAVGSP